MTDDLTQADGSATFQALPQGQGLAGRDHEGGAGAHRDGQSRRSTPSARSMPSAALKAARASERRWKKGKPLSPIDGVPVSIKELVRVKGWPASMGSKLTDKTPADADAPAVARLREAGAIVFAQSTSSEYRPQGRDRFAAARHHAQSVEHRAHAGRLVGRRGRRGRGGPGAARHRHRRRRLGAHPLELQRPGRAQGHVRPRAGLAAAR